MLFLLSTLLLIGAAYGAFTRRDNILHPAFWTNVGFVGYAVGGAYYFAFGYENARYLNLAKIPGTDRDGWFLVAISIVLVGFVVCNVGFFLGDRYAGLHSHRGLFALGYRQLPRQAGRLGGAVAVVLTALGIAYWIYFAQQIAGGIIPMFAKVGVYHHIVGKGGVSSLPFHLAYGGVLLWILVAIDTKRRCFIALLLIPVGAVIILSTGRIAMANGFAFAAILTYYFAAQGRANWTVFMGALAILLPFNVVFYFFRRYTSFVYIGKAEMFELALPVENHAAAVTGQAVSAPHTVWDVSWFDWLLAHGDYLAAKISYVFRALIGGGNVPDLQQIVLIVHGLIDGRLKLTYGSTYFDWINNLMGAHIGSPNVVQSVGFRVLAAYFPNKVGGPTPGMIGEAILNFGLLAPLAIFAFCFAMALVYMRASRSQSLLVKLLYCQFLVGIWALFLKVDSSLLLGYLWAAGPVTACWLGLRLLADLGVRAGIFPPDQELAPVTSYASPP